MTDRYSRPAIYARFSGSSVQHTLTTPGSTVTRCGKDATAAARYGPFRGNLNRDCAKCAQH